MSTKSTEEHTDKELEKAIKLLKSELRESKWHFEAVKKGLTKHETRMYHDGLIQKENLLKEFSEEKKHRKEKR